MCGSTEQGIRLDLFTPSCTPGGGGASTYQIGYIGHLYGIVYDLGACAAVALLEHRLIDYNRSLDILGGLAYIALVTPCSIWMYFVDDASGKMFGASREAPRVQVARVGASLIGLGACLKYHVRMFLQKFNLLTVSGVGGRAITYRYCTNKTSVTSTYRKITAVKGMYDEGLVANVYDTADAIASVEGCTGARIVFDCAMIVAVLDILQEKVLESCTKISLCHHKIPVAKTKVLSIVVQFIMWQLTFTQIAIDISIFTPILIIYLYFYF